MSSIPDNIQSVLDRLYPNPPVPLDHTSDFTFLVAVVLSAQTTDGKVNEVTRILFKHADNPESMAELDVDFVLNIIRPLGLAPKKAENVVKLSNMLVTKFNSKVPATYEELESLPGVGHKTASVIMSQVHKVPQIAVDTHVHRLSLRWGLSKDEKNVDNVQRDLCSIFPEKDWNKLHLQMIYFGREYCTAKLHENSLCPMCSWVRKKDGKPPVSFHQFPIKQQTKGIVYYGDRLRELNSNPTLALHSPHKHVKVSTSATETSVIVSLAGAGCSALGDIKMEPSTTTATKITKTISKQRQRRNSSDTAREIVTEVTASTTHSNTPSRKRKTHSVSSVSVSNEAAVEVSEGIPVPAVVKRRSVRSTQL